MFDSIKATAANHPGIIYGDHFISQNGLSQPEADIFSSDMRLQNYISYIDAIYVS